MSNGASTLAYSLYVDSARSVPWGDGSAGTRAIGDSGSGAAQSQPIYGRIAPGQASAPPGAYSDSVTITISY